MQHILEKKAFIYPRRRKNPDMSNFEYLDKEGYWVNKYSSNILIKDVDGPRPQSKKCDQETGEDRKGE